ncbi:MAG: hypothetical protein JXA94_05060 [Parachlamydiales bacterium]|nr:hypothetical protein [Parachlamydiales bacterium]
MEITQYFFSTWDVKEVLRYSSSKNSKAKKIRQIEIIDMQNLDRYRYEPKLKVAIKCFLIFLANPLVTFFKMFFNMLQFAYDNLKYNFECTLILAQLKTTKSQDVFQKIILNRIQLFKDLLEDVAFIIRAPIFALALQFASVFGIIFPYDGKKMISSIEKSWHGDFTYKNDFRHMFEDKSQLSELVSEAFKNRNVTFYLSLCFQPIGNLKDQNIIRYLDA